MAKLNLKDPGARSKIPTSKLPAKYRAMRLANQRRAVANDPEALTAPLTPASLDRQVQAQTSLFAAPAEAEIAQQRQVSQQQMAAIPSWFADYQAALQRSTQQTGAAYAAAAGMQQNVANTSSALDTQQRAQQQQGMQADAAARGVVIDPSIDAQAQQAAASRRSMLDAQTGLTAGIGAAQVAYSGSRERAGAAQKVSALDTERRRGLAIDKSASDLAREKGSFATKTRQQLTDAEHTKQLERKAFGLNVEKAKADVATDQASLQLKRQEDAAKRELDAAHLSNDSARIKIAQGHLDVAKQRADEAGAGKPKARTAGQKSLDAHTRSDLEYAKDAIKRLQVHKQPVKVRELDKDGKPTGRWVVKLNNSGNPVLAPAKLTSKQIRQALADGAGPLKALDKDTINAAYDLVVKGHLSKANVEALHRRGVSVGALGYQTEGGRARVKAKRKAKPSSQLGRVLETGAPIRKTKPK